MKSAYERAMERFGDDQPTVSLTDEQRVALAKVDEKFQAKIAEREVFLDDLIKKAVAENNFHELAQIEEQKRREVSKLEAERDVEKDKIRAQA